jgi:uncharacterized protein YciI
MFIVILKYIHGIEAIDRQVDAHRLFLDNYYLMGKFICSGAQIPRNGGIILCNANSKEEVWQIIYEDPFYINKVAGYEVIEFAPSKFAPAFESFIL